MATVDDLAKQILAQNTTSKWTGQGFGSAKANATDMAKILSSIGITDIKQFGLIEVPDKYVGLTPRYNARNEIVGYTSQKDGSDVPLNKARLSDDGGLIAPLTTYGNKVTGQAVPNTYSERQTGNAWGGTFAGDGNTGYRVDFTPDGTPVFYTTGASSSDVGQYMPIIQLALAATGAGGLLGNALLGAGANQVAAGALGGALLGGGASALTGQDILKGALIGGAGGALSGYLNPATGEIMSTPTEGSIPVTGDDIAKLGGQSTSGFYDEITGKFINDPLGGLTEPLTNATSGTNIGSMAGYDYDPVSGNWTMPSGEIVNTLVTENPITDGGKIMRNAGAMPVASIADKASAAAKGLSLSDALRAAGLVGTLAGGAKALDGGGSGGFSIVPVPTDWKSPPPTSVAQFTPLAPIDFGNKQMLRGTQWERLLDPNYGQTPVMPTFTNPSNMSFEELTRILGNSRESIPTQNLSINDVIAGIQSQYGQAPQGSMG